MKKIVAALLAVALLGLCLCGAALASNNVKFKSSAYVYSHAGWSRSGIVIRKGSVAEYVGQQGSWVQIRFGKSLGWVRLNCLMATGDAIKVVYSAVSPVESLSRQAGN